MRSRSLFFDCDSCSVHTTYELPLVFEAESKTNMNEWAVVVAQLVERSLQIPEVRGSNPVIGKNLY